MRILLDECVPQRLKNDLAGHDVQTVSGMGWSGKKNGELLRMLTASGFEVLLTVDQGIRHQQNLHAAGGAVVVLVAASNRYADLAGLIPSTLAALASIQPGELVEIN